VRLDGIKKRVPVGTKPSLILLSRQGRMLSWTGSPAVEHTSRLPYRDPLACCTRVWLGFKRTPRLCLSLQKSSLGLKSKDNSYFSKTGVCSSFGLAMMVGLYSLNRQGRRRGGANLCTTTSKIDGQATIRWPDKSHDWRTRGRIV
jgi:hypothetical protein